MYSIWKLLSNPLITQCLQSLAISYTNESYDRAAYNMLLRWLGARFPDFPISDETRRAVSLHSTWDSHDKLTETFLTLARQQYNQGIVDPDTQTALGVLFYATLDYERAKDCFESALSQRPGVRKFGPLSFYCD